MRFRIDRDNCFCREEENGTLSLIVKKNNQILYLNESGREVLNFPNRWMDLDEFVDALGVDDAPRDKVRGDYEALLYRLNAYGLAEIDDARREKETGVRLANVRDCKALSEFYIVNMTSKLSCAVSDKRQYYENNAIYFRMAGKREFTAIDEAEGAIKSAVSVSCPNKNEGRMALSLDSAVFAGDMSKEDRHDALKRTLEYIKSVFGASCGKIRYRYMNKRQDDMLEELKRLGFAQTAFFEREIIGGRDCAFYDLFMRA